MLEIRGQVLHRVRVHLKVDEGLTLETSAFQIVHGGNSTFINTFDKPNFPVRLNQARVQGFFLATKTGPWHPVEIAGGISVGCPVTCSIPM